MKPTLCWFLFFASAGDRGRTRHKEGSKRSAFARSERDPSKSPKAESDWIDFGRELYIPFARTRQGKKQRAFIAPYFYYFVFLSFSISIICFLYKSYLLCKDFINFLFELFFKADFFNCSI